MLRGGRDRLGVMLVMASTQSVVSIALLPFFGLPTAAAWPFLVGSWVLHTGYKIFLLRAYDHGDFGQVYPIARGAAPLMVAAVGAALLSEVLSPLRIVALLAIVAGVVLVSRPAETSARMPLRALGYALGSAAFTAGYTLVDGVGARVSGDASTFTLWMFAGDGAAMLVFGALVRGRAGAHALAGQWRPGVFAGVLSLGSYWIAIWAFTKAPIALVAALRESSVLFAMAIGVLLFGEKLTARRIAAGLLIVAGAAVLRLA